MPKVSIPIATYNRAGFLEECLNSCFSQTYKDIEVIVVDDGSTDNTPEVAAKFGDRLKYVRQEHRGNIATYYHARSLCTGKYMTYFGDDDLLFPTFIERGVEILESDPSLVKFCSDCYMIDRKSRRLRKETYLHAYGRSSGRVTLNDLLMYGCFVHGGMDRRSVFQEIGYYDTSFPHACDYDMYLRMTGAGYGIYYSAEPLWSYRIHSGMRSHRESEMWKETVMVLETNLARFPPSNVVITSKVERKIGMMKAWLAVRLFWERQLSESISYALAATRNYPPAVVLGALQMAYSNLKGRQSIYQLGD